MTQDAERIGTASASRGAPDPVARAHAQLRARLRETQAASPAPPTLDELIVEIAELRPLPAVAYRVIELSEDDRFSAHDLTALIAQDQALTARLLRLANSAYYGHARRIATIRDAVVLLGCRAVRSATLATCLMDGARRSTHVDVGAFWTHSLAVAMLAEVLARTDGANRDAAFTAGTLHNIGLLALDQQRPDLLAPVIERARETGISIADATHVVLGFSDSDLGAALAEHWGFPPALVEAVRDHRQLPGDLRADPERPVAYVVRARLLVFAHGLPDGLTPAPAAPAMPAGWAEQIPGDLDDGGGMEALMERVDAFLSASLV